MTVALVGADGAGKSTMCRELERADLPAPVATLYMGINLDASALMLPTTRLLVAAKRLRGGRPDLVAGNLQAVQPRVAVGRSIRLRRELKDAARLAVWTSEEWFRQLVAAGHRLRGRIVVFDRHFLADYYFALGADRIGAAARAHKSMLAHAYPRPDLVICLDAPAQVLHLRKPESTLEWLEHRRTQYLRLRELVQHFVVVDADRPLAEVREEVVQQIRAHWRGKTA